VSNTLSLNSNIQPGHPVRVAYFELLNLEDLNAPLPVNDVIIRLKDVPSSSSISYINLLSQLLSEADAPLKSRVVNEVKAIIERSDNSNPNISNMQVSIGYTPSQVTAAAPDSTVNIARLATPSSVGIPTGGEVDLSKGDPSKLTTKQEPTITYPPAADWGMRVTQVDTNKSYFFSLLPAMDSVIPMTASKDVPNALPGLHIRVKANIAKLRVPGSTPIYQHMGIDSVMITVVGMFTGVDGDKPSPATYLSHATGKDKVGTLMAKLDTYGAMQSFYEHAYLSGADLDVEINMARYQAFDVKEGVIRSAKTGNPRFRGHLSLLEVAHARSDRTYYTLQFETRSLTEDKCEITKIEHIPASLKEAISRTTEEEQDNARNVALAIIDDIDMAKDGKDGKTLSQWESGDPDPTGQRLSVHEVCDKDGTCRYYVVSIGQVFEVTGTEAIKKLKDEKYTY
jgi:hypothetical protein